MTQHPEETRQRAVAAVLAGRSRRAVSQELRVPRATIALWAREAGAPPHPGQVQSPGTSSDVPSAPTPEPVPQQPPEPEPVLVPEPQSPRPAVREDGAAAAVPPAPATQRDVPVQLRRRRRRPLVAAAAVLAVVAAAVVTAVVVTTGPSSEDLAQEYDAIADDVDAAYAAQHPAWCDHVGEVVRGTAVFDRAAIATVTQLAVVGQGNDMLRGSSAASDGRDELVAVLEGAVPTTDQRTIQSQFGSATDPEQACLDSGARRVDRVGNPAPPHVADMRALLEEVRSEPETDDANLARVSAAVVALAPAVEAIDVARDRPVSDALQEVGGVATDDDLTRSADRVGAAVTAMREDVSPVAVMDAVALLADYVYVARELAGDVIVLQGVALTDPPSQVLPVLAPERSLRTAIAAIPSGIETPDPGPAPSEEEDTGR